MRTKVDIHLGISEEKVEIDPKQQSREQSKYWVPVGKLSSMKQLVKNIVIQSRLIVNKSDYLI